ncbi:hypothetical protein AGDE_16496 [Angomonas deanei]|uniref:Uncharacterized protein n=1 Tax=Angomonas deanei TaxID=59799 RepID=A0A7G2C6E1_9TRYP|nr:hypothetical protein AGDE_16496 [Angomonas deanei]CAD2214367.1 hypothetical protein, conserved [Angomonas deanei]|eukprot:EPY16990.1 hypothetical protein AGDE_16496 [Angomonas deanei]
MSLHFLILYSLLNHHFTLQRKKKNFINPKTTSVGGTPFFFFRMDPATRKEAESWVERVNAIASAVDALLHDDHTSREEDAGSVEEAIIARQKRLAEAEEAAKREEMETKQKEKMEIIKKRYDPKYYARFDRDDYIDQLMQEIEEKEKKSSKDEKRAQAVVMDASVEYTDTERILVEEAAKRKALSNACVAQQAYQEAITHLDAALVLLANRITLDPLLYATLVNNRSFLWNKLGGYEKAVEDSSEAIRLLSLLAQHSPENSDGTDTTSVKTMLRKAYLRRCVALKCLGRPPMRWPTSPPSRHSCPPSLPAWRWRRSRRNYVSWKGILSWDKPLSNSTAMQVVPITKTKPITRRSSW